MTKTEYVQLFDDDGRPLCSRKTKTCSQCKHRYVGKDKEGSEYHLLYCPECGFPRGCRMKVEHEGAVCRMHSKDALKGEAHPNAKHLRHSKYVPKHLLPSYEATMQDEQRLDLSAEIAVMDSLIDDRLQALAEADSRDAWEQVSSAVDRLEKAIAARNPKTISSALSDLHDLTSRERDAARTREELGDLIMKRKMLTDSDRQRLSMLGEYMTRGAVLTLLKYMIEIVFENVKDLDGSQKALSAISAAFGQLIGRMRSSETSRGLRDGRHE